MRYGRAGSTTPVIIGHKYPPPVLATCALTTGATSFAASATFTPPTFSGSAVLTVGATQFDADCTFTAPTFSCTSALTTGNVEFTATCIFSSSVSSATAALTTGGQDFSSTAIFTPPIFSATCAVANTGATLSGTLTFVTPTYSGILTTGFLSRAIQNLLCFDAAPVEADFVQLVSDLNDIIDDQSGLSPEDLKFLDQASYDGDFTYFDRDYWLEMVAKKYLTLTGRTFGIAAPSNLAEADPLGLRFDTAGVLRTDVIILDPNGANESTTQTDAPVKITRASNNCTTPGGLAKSPAAVWSITGETYRYQFWTRLADLNEASGGSNVRFKDAPTGTVENQEVTVYVRFGNHEAVREELIWRKRVAGFHAKKIVIRGYPTDAIPSIRIGNSAVDADGVTLDDISPATVGNINGGTALPAIINVGNVATRERLNVNINNIELVGNRDLIGASGRMYCATLILYNGGGLSSGAIERCRLVDFQFIRDDDPNIGTHPNLVDTYFDLRNSTDPAMEACYGVQARCDNFIFNQNYVRPVAIGSWPTTGTVNPSGITGHSLLLGSNSSPNSGDRTRITQNKFEGLKANTQIECRIVDDIYIAFNDVEVYDNSCIYLKNCNRPVIEFNRVHDFGDEVYELENVGQGIVTQGCNYEVIRYNVIYNHEPTTTTCYGIWIKVEADETHKLPRVYGNLLYRNGLYYDLDAGTNTDDVQIYKNLISGMTEDHKGVAHRPTPILVNLAGMVGDIPGTLNGEVALTDNAIWRFANATPYQLTIESGDHLSVRNGGSSNFYDTGDTLTGWTGNFTERPSWDNDPEATNDFTLDGTNTFLNYFHSSTPFAATPAWDANPLDDYCDLVLGIRTSITMDFNPPVYTGTLAQTINGADFSASGTVTQPVYTGTLAQILNGPDFSSSVTFTPPVFTATLAKIINGADFTASAIFLLEFQTYTAIAPCLVGGVEFSSLGKMDNSNVPLTIYGSLFQHFDINI